MLFQGQAPALTVQEEHTQIAKAKRFVRYAKPDILRRRVQSYVNLAAQALLLVQVNLTVLSVLLVRLLRRLLRQILNPVPYVQLANSAKPERPSAMTVLLDTFLMVLWFAHLVR